LLSQEAEACFLDTQVIYLENENSFYQVKTEKIFGSILYKNSATLSYPEETYLSKRGEDVVFAKQFSEKKTTILKDSPYRIRVFHGKNVTPENDIKNYLEKNQAVKLPKAPWS